MPSPPRIVRNPHRGTLPPFVLDDAQEVLEFHRKLPDYAPTPLVKAGERLWVKDESHRLGLPAFKMLGASWGTYQALRTRLGDRLRPWRNIDELRAQVAQLKPLTLATATDGNHGRAVARMGRLLDLPTRVYLPVTAGPVRIQALKDEGAEVIAVDGIYDEALARCVDELKPTDVFASDADHRGEEGFARTVLAGYGTLLHEAARQLDEPPEVLMVQMGVGSLASGMIASLARLGWTTEVIGVEPADADCVLQALAADHLVFVPGPHRSQMQGLNCAQASDLAWPLLRAGLSAVVAIEDDWAEAAMAELAELGIESGHSGAAGLAGYRALGEELAGRSVLVINTEGATHLHA